MKMDDSKQEVIKELIQIRRDTDNIISGNNREDWAEYVYDRIAPLMQREFPERIIREGATSLKDNVIVVYFNNLKDIERDINALVEEYLTDLKRIWEGQGESYAERRKGYKPIPWDISKPKSTCPFCDGTGDIKKGETYSAFEIFRSCPFCIGTGKVQRRKGKERRERKNRRNPAGEYYDMDRRIATSGLPYPNRQTDRRTWARRKC